MFRWIEGPAGRAEPDFFRAPVLCLASSFAPPSSDGHGQHRPLDEAFILRRRKERGSAPQGCWGRDIGHQPRCRGHNGARGAGIHNTPRGIHVCVDARLGKEGRWRVRKDVWGRRNELEPQRCLPRPLDMRQSTSGAGFPQDQDETPQPRLGRIQRLLRFPIHCFLLV